MDINVVETSSERSDVLTDGISSYTMLFNEFFGFREPPFTNTANPHLFYMSKRHREVLTSMLFGIEQRRGFIVVTGEIGAGKTTLCRRLLHQLSPDMKTAVILNPNLSATHLLAAIVHDFGIECKGRTKKHYFDALNAFLLKGLGRNENACLIIDETQCLSRKVIEEIRLLSNLETSERKLLQIVLMGQPELKDILMHPSLTQLRQRIGVFCHLGGLDSNETQSYIEHRLSSVTDGNTRLSMTADVINKIHEMTRGIPRLINGLCERILMCAYAQQTTEITMNVSHDAFEDAAFICAR